MSSTRVPPAGRTAHGLMTTRGTPDPDQPLSLKGIGTILSGDEPGGDCSIILELIRPRTSLMQGLCGLRAIGRLLVPLHVQRDPLAKVLGRPHRGDALLRLAIAPVTSFHRIGGRRQEFVI